MKSFSEIINSNLYKRYCDSIRGNYLCVVTEERANAVLKNDSIAKLNTFNTITSSQSNIPVVEKFLFTEPFNTWLNELIIRYIDEIPDIMIRRWQANNKVIAEIFNGTYKPVNDFIHLEIIKRCIELTATLNRLRDIKILFYDTETTGLDKNCLPVQMAGILTDYDLNPIKKFSIYVKQDFIDARASAVNGLTTEFLNNKGVSPKIGAEFLKTLLNKYNPVIVGHNVQFDINATSNLYRQAGIDNLIEGSGVICTYKNRKCYPQLPNYKLSTIAECYNIDLNNVKDFIYNVPDANSNNVYKDNFHDALFDAATTLLIVQQSGMLNERMI